ncbi:MAG: HEAT repeat domain-containing protein, partial [Kiritimatiellae bacterium]|nr:HEAT repeat domain-containing protein [Kiritimatiellia bacterium]
VLAPQPRLARPAVALPLTLAYLRKAVLRHRWSLTRHTAPGRRNPGIRRLSRWVKAQLAADPARLIPERQLIAKARELLPEFIGDRAPDGWRSMKERADAKRAAAPPVEAAVEQALADLLGRKPAARVRGLQRMAELAPHDLFDWCMMYLDDTAPEVRVAALHTMLRCDFADMRLVTPLADAEDRRVRGAAIAALVRHGGDEAAEWMRAGLTDPSPHVRLEAVQLLPQFDAQTHSDLFEFARYDPNPDVRHRAEQLIAGKGFPKAHYRTAPGRV